MPALSLNMTAVSPPPTTTLPDVPIAGNAKTLKPVPAAAFVDEVMTPATKSPSNTIAAFDGDANTCDTEVGKSVCSAPEVPPAMSAELPTI